MMQIRDLMENDYQVIQTNEAFSFHFIEQMEEKYLIILNQENNELKLYRRDNILLAFCKEKSPTIEIDKLVKCEEFILLKENEDVLNIKRPEKNQKVAIIVNEKNEPVGIIDNISTFYQLVNEWNLSLFRDNLRLQYYKSIFNGIEEEIFVTDEYGFIQFLNPYAEKVCDIKLEDYIGRHVTDLEQENIISSSISMEVLKTKKKVSNIVKMKTGKTILATGVPVYDENGSITSVVSTSKDVKEISHLINELEQKKNEIGLKNKEIMELKERMITQDNYVLQSDAMKDIQKNIIKVAPTDISILIQGESGVGKGVITDLIHKLSSRHEGPLIKINCGLIPENLLESELFGYESGAFTGAAKGGKIGKIALADKGTIFFDEIGELPLPLQVKLLDFLQDREIMRIGGTKKIPIDTRVVAATNKDLKSMVMEGKFRGDLYYRLTVMPITLPPLRNRLEDIVPLAKLFLQKFNLKYKLNKKFLPEVLTGFLEYSWPGNVRELMHVVERLIVTSDEEIINVNNLRGILSGESRKVGEVICTDLLPLKQAKSQLEFHLVQRAYEMYGSTYKAGAALGVDQSTVVKILKRHGYKKKQ